ncbi:MAG: YfgM family protein [Endozoicomonas sp.]
MSYQSDDEQVELLKSLWKDYGQPVVLALAITLAGVSGYKYWNKVQYDQAAEASALYQNLLDTLGQQAPQQTALTKEQKATVSHVVKTLQDDFTDSRYAQFATLFQAQQQVLDDQLTEARASLEWVLARKPGDRIETMVSVRLARVLLGESDDNARKALDVLAVLKADEAYGATIESARGDAYLALGQKTEAEAAYQKALDTTRGNGENRPLLQLKLDDLAAMAPQEG